MDHISKSKDVTTSERLNQLMMDRHLRQIDIINLAKPYYGKYHTKIGRNDISQYLSGKVVPGSNKLSLLAEALNVNEDWLKGYDVNPSREDNIIKCNTCGLTYSSSNHYEVSEHNQYHDSFVKAKQRFPELLPPEEAWELRLKCTEIRDEEKEDTEERFKACVGIIQYYFSRSLRAQLDNAAHPSFNKYAAMLLNQEHFKESFGVSYERLKKHFGTMAGIENGRTYYENQEESNTNYDDKLHSLDLSSESDTRAFKMYKTLDNEDKAEIRGEMKQMLKADKYKENEEDISTQFEIAAKGGNINQSPDIKFETTL